jgi:hypothetical protein
MTSVPFSQLMQDSTTVGEPVPAGKYPAIVEKCAFGVAKNGQDPQWKFTWRLQGGAQNNRPVMDQQTLPLNGPDMDKVRLRRGFFFRDMGQLGFDRNFFMTDPDGNVIAQMLVGRSAMIEVTVDGKYNNVNGYEPLAGQQAPAQPMQQAQPQPGGFAPQPAQQFAQQQAPAQFQQPAAAQPQQGFQPQPAQQFPPQQPAASAQPPSQPVPPGQQYFDPQTGQPVQLEQPQMAGQQQAFPQAQPAQPAQPAPQAFDPNTGQPLTQQPPAPF